MKDVMICTVGTSLFGNLRAGGKEALWGLLEKGDSKDIASKLLSVDPDDRLCGAEINSNFSIFKNGVLKRRNSLYLLVSDTGQGRQTGDVLRHYYTNSKNPWRFEKVEVIEILGLSHESAEKFRSEGLKNLVKKIAEVLRKEGKERVLINSTGGYKAQISFAGIIGQALGIPVYYMFEGFSSVIELPPQPVALDPRFWLQNVELFYDLSESGVLEGCPVPDDERFHTLVEAVDVDGKTYYELTALGLLFHESHREQFRAKASEYLPPKAGIPPGKKKIIYEDGNARKHRGLEAFLKRFRDLEFVKGIRTFYYNKDLPRKTYFKVATKNRPFEIESCYTDGKATTKFALVTTAQTLLQARAAVADLKERFLED